ncbi:hypothetical protein [Marispirochaeta sp.]|uniref:hypothetical protein n=1 Tax=Marispirochaeta sp. TaxID=2038653 RepID=UPI0029C8F753|nr:hypothetical protein [Marispirochaeta sp.]
MNTRSYTERIQRILFIGSERFQTNYCRRDGSVFTVDISASYIDSGGGRLVCFCLENNGPPFPEDINLEIPIPLA